jgi:hypothetical protein
MRSRAVRCGDGVLTVRSSAWGIDHSLTIVERKTFRLQQSMQI